MNTFLDESHASLLQHWKTFECMKKCAEDIERHLIDAAQCAAKKSVSIRKDFTLKLDKLEKHGWLNIIPERMQNFGGQAGFTLLVLGLEGVSVSGLISGPLEGRCQSYVYFENDPQTAPFNFYFQELRLLFATGKILPPVGFEVTTNPEDGYLCTQRLAPLQPKELLDEKVLCARFSEMLQNLLVWYDEHAGTFEAIGAKR